MGYKHIQLFMGKKEIEYLLTLLEFDKDDSKDEEYIMNVHLRAELSIALDDFDEREEAK